MLRLGGSGGELQEVAFSRSGILSLSGHATTAANKLRALLRQVTQKLGTRQGTAELKAIEAAIFRARSTAMHIQERIFVQLCLR